MPVYEHMPDILKMSSIGKIPGMDKKRNKFPISETKDKILFEDQKMTAKDHITEKKQKPANKQKINKWPTKEKLNIIYELKGGGGGVIVFLGFIGTQHSCKKNIILS